MKIYKLASQYVAYHGTPSPFGKFDITFTGEGYDQEGPGIYFTSDYEDALKYTLNTGVVKKVELSLSKVVPLSGQADEGEARQLLLWSMGLTSESELDSMDEDAYWETMLSNWGEHPATAFESALSGFMSSYSSPHDLFMGLWHDFYRYDAVVYLKNMVKLGYDGVIIPKDWGVHYVVFNPNVIQEIE